MKFFKLFLLLFFINILNNPLNAQEIRNLSIDECVQLGLKNNFDIQKSHYDVLTTKEITKQYEAQYDPSINASIGKSKTKNSEDNSFYGTDSEVDSAKILLNKKFFNSGGTLNFNWLNEKEDSNSLMKSYFGAPNPSYTTSLSMSYSQPIYKNFLGRNDKKYLKTARVGETISELALELQKNNLANAIEKTYLDFNFADKNLETQKMFLERAKKLLKINKQKLRDGLIEEVDVIATDAAVKIREASILLAEAQVQNAEDLLKNLIGLSADSSFGFKMREEKEFKHQKIQLDAIIKIACSRRPDLKIIDKNIMIDVINKEIRKDEKRTSLSLDTSYSLNSYSGDLDENYSSLLPSWYLGLSINLFPFNKLNKSLYTQSEYSHEKNRADLEYKRLQIITECRDIVRKINTQALYVDASYQALLLQQKKLSLEEKKFNQGRSSINWLLTFEDDLSRAEIDYQKALTDYYKAQSDLRLIIGKHR